MHDDTDELTCREINGFLDAYLSRTLDNRERNAFDAHLAACEDCRVYLRQYELTLRLSRDAFGDTIDPEVPEELVQAILTARTSGAPPAAPAPRRRR